MKPNPERDAFQKHEYAWIHKHCNIKKSNKTFLIQKLVGPNDILYSVDTKSITKFLRDDIYPIYKSQIGPDSTTWLATRTDRLTWRYQYIIDLFPEKEDVRDFMMQRINDLRKNIVNHTNAAFQHYIKIEEESNQLVDESKMHSDPNDDIPANRPLKGSSRQRTRRNRRGVRKSRKTKFIRSV